MSSHGKILDLFDNSQLVLQDVEGNVEPLPKLLRYKDFIGNIMLFKMETPHDVFMGLIQDFTDRYTRNTTSEAWSWVVQWEVNESATPKPSKELMVTPVFKKPKLWTDKGTVTPCPLVQIPPPSPPRQEKVTSFKYCLVDNELLKYDDIMRLLLDLVQADDQLLPNYIEMLYASIDYYEGSGYALRCALAEEIPSLWDFEQLPVLAREDVDGIDANAEGQVDSVMDDETEFNNDPVLIERSKYREKRLGMQPPKGSVRANRGNMPTDPLIRDKYFAACYRSRKRAIALLERAGMSMEQIRNYEQDQETAPLDTPMLGTGRGLDYYRSNQAFYERHVYYNSEAFNRSKIAESVASAKLDQEAEIQEIRTARQAASFPQNATSSDNFLQPLIPSTPCSALRPDATDDFTPPSDDDTEGLSSTDIDKIELIPAALFGLLKADVFADAKPGEDYDVYGLIPEDQGIDDGDGENEDEHEAGTRNDETANNGDVEDDKPMAEDEEINDDEEMDDEEDSEDEEDDEDDSDDDEDGDEGEALEVTSTSTTTVVTSAAAGSTSQVPDSGQTQGGNVGAAGTNPVWNALLQGLVPSLIAPADQPTHAAPFGPQPAIPTHTHSTALTQGLQGSSVNTTHQQAPAHSHASGLTPGLQGLAVNNSNQLAPAVESGPSLTQAPLPSPNDDTFNQTPRLGIRRGRAPPKINTNIVEAGPPTIALLPLSISNGEPVLLYFPSILPSHASDRPELPCDAVMLGYRNPRDDRIDFTRAIFLPTQIFNIILRRIRTGGYTILETFRCPKDRHGGNGKGKARFDGSSGSGCPHTTSYERLAQAFSLLTEDDREAKVTKRWRVSPGMMTETARGCVWEGWALTIDRRIGMNKEEWKVEKKVTADEDEDEDEDEDFTGSEDEEIAETYAGVHNGWLPVGNDLNIGA